MTISALQVAVAVAMAVVGSAIKIKSGVINRLFPPEKPAATASVDTTPETFRRQIDVNLVSAFLVARAVLPGMLERGGGAGGEVDLVEGARRARDDGLLVDPRR